MAQTLPQFQTDDKDVGLLQNKWAAILNPLLANPVTSASILTNVKLAAGSNTINHKLQQKLQGWIIIGNDTASKIYDQQASNPTPDLTLKLVTDIACTVQIAVF